MTRQPRRAAGRERPDVRRLVASAISSGQLTHRPLTEAPVDRIGALAFADPLGTALWRLRWCRDLSQIPVVVGLIAGRLRKGRARLARTIASRVAAMAVQEWLADGCRACEGRGVDIGPAGVRSVCSTCEGSGLHRYSDSSRATALGVNPSVYRRGWEPIVQRAHSIIGTADVRAMREVLTQLERRGGDDET